MRLLVYATGTGEAPKIQDLPPEAAALWEHPHLQRTLELALPLNEKRVFLAAMARRDPAHKKQYLGLLRKLNFDTRFPYLTLKAVAEK